MPNARNPGTAAVLSMILPGIGQFYTGHWGWGIFWFIVTPGFWLGSGGLFGWVAHVLSAMQAYSQANNR